MQKSFLVRTFLLVMALIAVLAVIVATMRMDLSPVVPAVGGEQTFFEHFVLAGGPIVWFVLLPMSLITVFLAFEHGLTIRRSKLVPCGIGRQIVEIIRRSGPGHLGAQIGDRGDFVSTAALKALSQGKGDWFRMRNALAESLQDQAWRLLRKIEWMNLIGNVSPMVGLFGTVFGMIKLFNAIVIAGGQPQPAQLADGISVALVTTFWGLFIAIPALAIHGVFRNRIETLTSDAVVEAENIVPEIRRSLGSVAGNRGKSQKPASVATCDVVKRQPLPEDEHAKKTKLPISELGSKPKRKVGESLPL
jgi:biopolymer transport protein ExbB